MDAEEIKAWAAEAAGDPNPLRALHVLFGPRLSGDALGVLEDATDLLRYVKAPEAAAQIFRNEAEIESLKKALEEEEQHND
ncbi:MAG: hypothetical protein FP824_06780 [Euryarchaeota archaeon]|nr:hypothetical protein [Euryarchaeota archaeon]MBU4071205.1 hypothetical protein [Candidatus Thermoplasmatota archaeon]MBU4144602.1 hypothetical protein [Candidatus Thermoplasmatota archaeon]